ncbi:hypothetical protein RsTz2092_02490 [Deferribacterales bacterium RsTz2092]
MPILNWLTREEDLKAAKHTPYRLLTEKPELSYGDKNTGNMLIQGDNLQALKALLPFYAGQVKCIFIDPPYNTGARKDADGKDVGYDDNLEHSIWLAMMYPRVELLRELLAEYGVISIQIDDDEMAYLKVIMDEVFDRSNFLNTISIKAKVSSGASGGGEDKKAKKNTEFVLMYCKNRIKFVYRKLYTETPIDVHIQEHKDEDKGFYYTRIIMDFGNRKQIEEVDGLKVFEHTDFVFSSISKVMKEENLTQSQAYSKYYDRIFMVTNAQTSILPRVNGIVNEKQKLISFDYIPTSGKSKGQATTKYIWNETLVVWFKDSANKIGDKVSKTEELGTSWDDISWGRLDLEGGIGFKNGKKPESLLERILTMYSDKGDLVLDSFLGSGTTAAVAQKMGRRYIGVEMGEHAKTHCAVRLQKVIDGEQGGISKAVGWTGGGGFRFFELGEPVFDEEGNIQPNITFDNLATHIWFSETKTPWNKPTTASPFLGVYNGVAYALLYNGILHDKRVNGGNVLTSKTLNIITSCIGNLPYDKLVVYGEASRVSKNIEFKQTPYDVKVR